jgi:transcriptional antiterminator NusG
MIGGTKSVIENSPNASGHLAGHAEAAPAALPLAATDAAHHEPPHHETARPDPAHHDPAHHDPAHPDAAAVSAEPAAALESPAEAPASPDAAAAPEAPAAEAQAAADAVQAPAPAKPRKPKRDPDRPVEEIPISNEPPKMSWYILKVQSNREESIREALQRRVAVAGLERFVGEIIVPTEMVSEFKGGKKRVVKRKLYPGYLVVNMEINEDTWFLVRETPGIGDFTGSAGKPTPMLPHEVQRILSKKEEKADEAPKLKIAFNVGDRVKINEGTFENFEGEVDGIDEASGRVTVMINIFGRSTPVELEYWQIEAI